MKRVSWSNVFAVLAALWVGVTCSGCALPSSTAQPVEPPRLYCLNMGPVPETVWWVYACTFIGGDSVAPDIMPIVPRTGTAS